MTVAPALTCGVCAQPLSSAAERCPACGAATATSPSPMPGPLPTLLAGCVRAGTGARVLAIAIDVVVAAGLVALGVLRPTLGIALLVAYVVASAVTLGLSGRTLGGLAGGLRTVDLFTGTPLYGRVLTPWRADGVTLDVRGGRDPLRSASSTEPAGGPRPARAPGSAAPHPAAPGGSGGWGPPPSAAAAPAPPTPTPAAPAQPTSLPAIPAPPAPASEPAGALGPDAAAPSGPAVAPDAAAPSAAGVTVTTADGGTFAVTGTALLGRNPQPRDGEQVDTLIPLPDLSRTVSKTHATLRWDGRSVWVTDRGSTNGSAVTAPGGGTRRLRPYAEEPIDDGSTIRLGDLSVVVTRGVL